MADLFPGYDVLAKRDTPSWNEQTRIAIDARLARTPRDDALTSGARAALVLLIDRIVPQPKGRPPVNALALVLDRIAADARDGYRHAALPGTRAAWERGLDAIDAEARSWFGRGFAALNAVEADTVLRAVQAGETRAAWPFPPTIFWSWRLIPDIVSAYYAHPSAWSAMGFGGPASPRGYVRLDADRRDPWEAAERRDGALIPAKWRNRRVV